MTSYLVKAVLGVLSRRQSLCDLERPAIRHDDLRPKALALRNAVLRPDRRYLFNQVEATNGRSPRWHGAGAAGDGAT